MTTNLKWRLSKLPTPEEVTVLVKDGILTKDEAREILFNLETDEDRDKASLQEEIKFLRALVDKMSTRSQILTYIPQVATPTYTQKPWWNGYQVYCSAIGTSTTNLVGGTANYDVMSSQGLSATYSYTEPNFTDISTF